VRGTAIKVSGPNSLTLGDLQKFTEISHIIIENAAERAVWQATEQDLNLISSGASSRQLAGVPLWHGTPPSFVSDSWRRLAVALSDTDFWWVWKNWYEDRLYGRQNGDAHDLIYATVPVEEWDKGPAAANKWIADRLAELDKTIGSDDGYLTSPPDDLSEMTQDEAVEAITNWFFENFEDPAHRTPYESAEGGYQYIWGGPYDARDVIENVFADTASEDLINAAVQEIEKEGLEWAPHSNRIQNFDAEEASVTDPVSLHTEMLERIEALEKDIAEIRRQHPGMGHNNPPEDIEIDGLTVNDFEEIQQANEVLKSQPVEPADDGKAAKSALDKLIEKLKKIGDYIWNEAKKKAVNWTLGLGGMWLYNHLDGLISVVSHWLKSCGLF